MKDYYDARAREYDRTSYGMVGEHGPELENLERLVGDLSPVRVLDAGCGTGYLTRLLRGEVVGVDYSQNMLRLAKERVPSGRFVRADVPPLPFADASFDRVFTSHFYGHLEEQSRVRFLSEARRVARELVVVDSVVQPDFPIESWEERRLLDGSRHVIWKRHFTPDVLLAELGGGEVLFDGRGFVAVAVGTRR